MKIITAHSAASAWINATNTILKEGTKYGDLQEILNMVLEIECDSPNQISAFDSEFRNIFGDERIDYAKSVSFVQPSPSPLVPDDLMYEQNKSGVKWTETYWGRLISWGGTFNQIEQVIKRLKEHKNAKTIAAAVYDPKSDARKTMAGMPCLLSLDFKPRAGELYMTAFFRSQPVSKSGYADYSALFELGEFLCEQADLKLKVVTNIAASGHVRRQNNERANSLKLLERLGCVG